MRYPNVTWHSILYDYLLTTELRHTCTARIMHTYYIYNGCRFTKSALRILLLSTFSVSTINYSLVCMGVFWIHTRSSANAEEHCQLQSCKMLHKCSTDCILKGLQPVNDLQGHSRSLRLLPFHRPYTISTVSISLSCTILEIFTLIC